MKCALFTYEFLSIHPFQDGNGRLSRLISTLLLLKNNYNWIQYISFEYEIESRKQEYYRVLRSCQAARPNENVSEWLTFYFDAIKNIQKLLMDKLTIDGAEEQLAPREKSIYVFIKSNSGCKSGQIAKSLNMTNPTVKRLLLSLTKRNLITRHSAGRSTNYTVV